MTDIPDRKKAAPMITDTTKSVRVRQALLLLAGALALELLVAQNERQGPP